MENIIGKKFGMWTAVQFNYRDRGQDYWAARCDCGEMRVVQSGSLKHNKSKSCGCKVAELARQRATTHGLKDHPIYGIWHGIKVRCLSEMCKDYHRYGGRGISICNEWKNDFAAFYNWSIDNGWQRGLQIDRLDNNGNYSPDNCRFVTAKLNANNRHDNRLITYKGQTKNITQWAESTGKPYSLIRNRLMRGWSVEKSLTLDRYEPNAITL